MYFIFGNCVSGHNMMVNRELISAACSRDIPAYILYDQWLALIASAQGGIKYISKTCCRHRMHNKNSRNNNAFIKSRKIDEQYFLAEVDFLKQFVEEINRTVFLEDSLRHLVTSLGRHAEMLKIRRFNAPLFFMLLNRGREISVHNLTFRHIRRFFKFCCGGSFWRLRYK